MPLGPKLSRGPAPFPMQVSGVLQFAEKLSPFLPNLTLRFKDRHKQKTSAPSSELGSKLLLQLDSSSEMNVFTKRKLPHSQRHPDQEETHTEDVRKGGSGFTSKGIGSEDHSLPKKAVFWKHEGIIRSKTY